MTLNEFRELTKELDGDASLKIATSEGWIDLEEIEISEGQSSICFYAEGGDRLELDNSKENTCE